MSYNITKSNGVTIGTIADGTYNNTATSLTLVGRNFSNYGQIMTNNLVRLIENSAYSISPTAPLEGQLWWNTSDKRLRVYGDSTIGWKIVSSCTSQVTAPSTTVAGDLWWDSAEEQLYVYNGTSPYSSAGWIMVGPPYKKSKGKSGAIWEQIQDTLGTTHDVVTLYLDGVRTAIISTDSEFTPNVAITGFSKIQLGHNLASAETFWGTANNASYLGAQPAANYLRSDISDTTDGVLTINNNGGLIVGTASNLQITTTTGGGVSIKNARANGDIDVYANIAGTNTSVLNVLGSTGRATLRTVTLSGVTTSTSASTGALIVGGGAGVAENLNVGGKFDVTGLATAVTAPYLTANTMIATTEFVINNSGFLKNKIYDGGTANVAATYIEVVDTGVGSANIVVDGYSVATASASGFNLKQGATAVTQAQTYTSTGNATVATTQYVRTAGQWWGGSAKFVSNVAPDLGVNDAGSVDGDFWFQREP